MSSVAVNGVDLSADHLGALYWQAERTLIVADMHLEKGSAFASRGQMLPPYDSAATLAKLNQLIARHRPKRLIALGDSFHDIQAGERMDKDCALALAALAASLEMIWITGNHDPEIPTALSGQRYADYRLGGLVFRHEPLAGLQPGEIAGHLHPVARLVSPKGGIQARAFISDGTRLLMPAFGSYAGGLNCRDDAISSLFNPHLMAAHICGSTRVYPVKGNRLVSGEKQASHMRVR